MQYKVENIVFVKLDIRYVYKAKIQSDGSLDILKLRILVRGYLKNKEMVGDTCSPTASMRTLKYFLADTAKRKARVHQLDFIGAFLQAKVKNRIFSSWTLGIQIIFQNMHSTL